MIGLTLSGGSAWGLAHIGVLDVFEEHGIKFDLITGTSAGAIVGSLLAAGISCNDILPLIKDLSWTSFGKPTFPQKGFLDSHKLEFLLGDLMGKDTTFDKLKIPLSVVASDLVTGKMVVLNQGNVSQAVRASACVPILFAPVEHQGRFLVDGGLVNNLPVDIAISNGAKKVVAVNFAFNTMEKERLNNQWEIGLRSYLLMQFINMDKNRMLADLIIEPKVDDLSPADFKNSQLLIDRGRLAALEALPDLKKLLALS